MSHATAAELADWIGRDLDSFRAELMVELASGAVDSAARTIGATVNRITDDVLLVDGNGDDTLMVPWPIEDVSEVSEVGDDGTETVLVGPGSDPLDYRWSRIGSLERVRGCWPCRPRSVKVTMTHGMDPAPTGIKTATLQAAARAYVNPSHLQSWDGDSTRAAFGGLVLELTEGERALVHEAIR